jgi:hypothetical protein
MGVIHALLFLLAFAFLLPLLRPTEGRLRIMLLVLAVLVFCDVAYAAYYNSFYMDAGAFVFFLLAIVFLVHAVSVRQHCSASMCYFALLVCLLFVTSKPQHALLGIPLALFFFWRRSSLLPSRSPVYGAVAAVSLAASGLIALTLSTPPGYTSPALFNMIFWGLLPSAQDPRAELASLGLDESFLQYNGMYAYLSGSPMHSDSFAQEFSRKTSYSRLSIFYATHPRRALDMVKIGLKEAARQRPPVLGNFDRSAGYPPYFQSSAFSVWSMAKTRYFSARPWSYLLAFAIATAIVTWRMPAGGLTLATMGLLALTIGSLADACDVTRHLFLFNVIWDVGFFAAICTLAMGTQPHASADPSAL